MLDSIQIRNFGLRNDPPYLFVYYYSSTGKSRRRKIPIREIPTRVQHGEYSLNSDTLVEGLLERHGEYLKQVPQKVLLDALSRILDHHNLDCYGGKYKLPFIENPNKAVNYPEKRTKSKPHGATQIETAPVKVQMI